MRKRRLLRNEEGAAPVEFVFAALFATFLLFALIEVAFGLYGRNVVAASAHEAARAAIELGGSAGEAEALARATVRRSAGNLVDDYRVNVGSTRSEERVVVRVQVIARLDPPGPLPMHVPVDLTATAIRETTP
jgi:Flp pilus assembly protein TadG